MVRNLSTGWVRLALAGAVLVACVPSPSLAAKAKQLHHKPVPRNQTKGQGQIAGGNGRFGIVYTLGNGYNFEILSAHYTMDPFVAYDAERPNADEKLLVVDVAIKNARPQDTFFNTEDFFQFVDDKGQIYRCSNFALASSGRKNSTSFTLRPGQGYGQPALHDPLRAVVELPGNARIVKIITKVGRAFPKEDTLRYYIAGATKEVAGEAGDPANVIAPLPPEVRDPSDPTGATALSEGKGTPGVYVPTGYFDFKLVSFGYTTDAIDGQSVPDGKKYAVATVTAKALIDKDGGRPLGMFAARSEDTVQVTDTDGEHYKSKTYLKAHQPAEADHDWDMGEEYTFRMVFEMPKDATAKTLVLSARDGRKWAYDVSGMK